MKTFQTDLGTVQKVFCFVLEAAHKNKQISCTFTAGVYLCLEKQKQDATLSDWQIIIVCRNLIVERTCLRLETNYFCRV